jgi:hypothetical protein
MLAFEIRNFGLSVRVLEVFEHPAIAVGDKSINGAMMAIPRSHSPRCSVEAGINVSAIAIMAWSLES